jgi:adenylate cyclase
MVFDFLGVPDPARPGPPMEPEARQSRLAAMAGQLARARSARGEIVVHLYEDLHWFDPASDAMLAARVEGWPGTRTLGLFTFRPEYRAPWMELPLYRALPLRPLGSAAVSELLHDLLGTDPSLAGLDQRIAGGAAGNPFFVEEVVQALVEAGHLAGTKGAYHLARAVNDLAIPPTVHALLAARVDRLPEEEKGVLQTAAVIGKEFTGPVLRVVTGLPDETLAAALDALARAEFLHETALYPEAEYAFKHPLTQEVAYRSLLGERRRQIHDAVARAIERTYPEKLDERAALVAHHWECAGDRLEAARWHHQAGRWVRARNVPEAMRHWRRARELLREVPESEGALRLGLAVRRNLLGHSWIVGMADDEARVLFEEGNALATRRKDLRSLALLRWGYGESRRAWGWVAEMSEHLREVLRLSEESGDDALTFAVRASLVMNNAIRGDLHEAERVAVQLLDGPPPDYRYGAQFFAGGATPLACAMLYLGRALVEQGRLDEGEPHLQRALQLAAEFGDQAALGMGRLHLVVLSYSRGDARGAMDAARLMMETAGSRHARNFEQARGAVALAHLGRQEWGDAASAFEPALAFCREHGVQLDAEAEQLSWLAEAHLGRGDPRAALATAEEAQAIGRSRGQQLGELDAEIVRARALVRLGGPDAAEAALAAAAALVERTGAGSRAPFLHLAQAALAAARGDPARRERELREAHRLFTAMGAPLRAEQVARELDT